MAGRSVEGELLGESNKYHIPLNFKLFATRAVYSKKFAT